MQTGKMYEKLIQSPNRPFAATPDPQFYFPHQSVEAARQTIERAVLRAEGPVAVLGGAGLGKSMLGRIIAEDLEERFDVVTLHAARLCSRQALLQSILFELNLPYKDLSEGELRLSILDRLEPSDQFAPEGVLIIVDEAHTLPSKLLDELRLISNFTRNNQPRTRLVLIGNLRLEDIFAEPQMDSFNQRLAARCYLQPMLRRETQGFVSHQLAVAGFDADQVITSDALATIYTATEGIPRLVNQLMDQAVVLAATNRQNPISASLIQDAWSDLQQLPAPWHATAESAISTEVAVEFGTLNDNPSSQVVEEEEPVSVIAFEPPAENLPIEQSDKQVEVAASDSLDKFEDVSAAEQCTELLQTNNFFAAFTQPLDSVEGDLHAAEPGQADVVSIETMVANEDGFFAGKPTDEQLLALQEEQAEYDSLGVWENDPPINDGESEAPRSVGSVSPAGSYTVHATADLFGADFEEEITVPVNLDGTENSPRPSEQQAVDDSLLAVASMSNVDDSHPEPLVEDSPGQFQGQAADFPLESIDNLEEISELGQLANSDVADVNWTNLEISQPEQVVEGFGGSFEQPVADTPLAEFASENDLDPAEIEEYVAQIQRYAEAVREATDEHAQVDEVISSSPDDVGDNGIASEDENWQIDISTADLQNELAVQQDVEDLVSQLNFSAFAVEPFSVEQIEIEARSNEVPEDSVRSINEEVHMLHAPVGAKGSVDDFEIGAEHDDDRDLLIIEDQVTNQQPLSSENQEEPKKVAPYGQLFSKLRN